MVPIQPDQRREKGERTRQGILEAAVDLIGLKGIKAFTAQALAERAKVSKAALYHHFKTLDEILPLTVDIFWDLYDKFLGGPKPPTLKAYLQRLGHVITDPKLMGHPIARASIELYRLSFFNEPVRKAMAGLLSEGRRRLRADLEAYAKSPAQARRARLAVDWLMPLGDGMQIYLPLTKDHRSARRAWSVAAAMAEAYIVQGAPRRRKEPRP